MFRNTLTLFGFGMIALWIIGLASSPQTPYMTWLDGVAGLISFMEAGVMPGATRGARSGSIILLSLGLFALWIGGLLGGAVYWQVWWTFAAACAYFIVGVIAGFTRPRGAIGEERPRRAA